MINPIWSGAGGSRWNIGKDNFTNSSKIPRFAHLLYDYQQLYEILQANYDNTKYDFFSISNLILNGRKEAYLNQLCFEDYHFLWKQAHLKKKY